MQTLKEPFTQDANEFIEQMMLDCCSHPDNKHGWFLRDEKNNLIPEHLPILREYLSQHLDATPVQIEQLVDIISEGSASAVLDKKVRNLDPKSKKSHSQIKVKTAVGNPEAYPKTSAALKKKVPALAKEPAVQPKAKEEPAAKKEKPKEEPAGDVKPILNAKGMEVEKSKLNSLKEKAAKSTDKNQGARVNILEKAWMGFVEAKTEADRVKAVRMLADNNLIEGHTRGKKIYLTPQVGGHYKTMTGGSSDGTAVTREMNKIIEKHKIDVPVRGGQKDKSLQDAAGKHNEAGLVMELSPKDSAHYKENLANHQNISKVYKELGGDVQHADATNKKMAELIRKTFPPGAKVIDAIQTGGLGKDTLTKMGIDPKVDPTDMLLTMKDKAGKTQQLKYSLKTYKDPNSILMKNAGCGSGGSSYIGGPAGQKMDEDYAKFRAEHTWDTSMPEEEKREKKSALKVWYMDRLGKEMTKLAKTSDGHKQLLKMWADVHGCGKNVHTAITNKITGEVSVHPPDHYCKPKAPLGVRVKGAALVVDVTSKAEDYLELSVKTEERGGAFLIFRHRNAKARAGEPAEEG